VAMAHTKAGARSSFATVNPYTNEVVREFPSLRGEEIDRVIERAHRAWEPWRRRSGPRWSDGRRC
jgi:succinate-semialdehyde dehydrogenase/glutarate-semialdehyde dehydrogenase